MIYLLALPAVAVLLVLYMRIEASMVEVKRIKVPHTGKTGFRIALMSDLHINRLVVPLKKLARILDREKPDLVVITGDCIEKEQHVPLFIELVKTLSKHRIILCLGNHDYTAFMDNMHGLKEFVRQLHDLGVTVLENDSVCIKSKNKKYNIIGIDDLRCGNPDIDKALASACSDADMNIALTHNPDTVYLLPEGSVDYLLCGHYHGGQIWTPFRLEFKTLRQDRLCRMGITRGMHRINNISIYINRGLGNVVFPLRFLSRPEITVLNLP